MSDWTNGQLKLRRTPQGYMADLCCDDRPDTFATTAFYGWTVNEIEANAKRLQESYNACLSMSNPDADVQALVNALNACKGYFRALPPTYGPTSMLEIINTALARLRREP